MAVECKLKTTEIEDGYLSHRPLGSWRNDDHNFTPTNRCNGFSAEKHVNLVLLSYVIMFLQIPAELSLNAGCNSHLCRK